MALYALDDLDDALDLTRRFLAPLDRRTWLKLALVVFFIAGPGTNGNGFQFSGSGGGGGGNGVNGDEVSVGDVELEIWVGIAALVLALLAFALAFVLVGSVMEFVFVESLRREEVTVRRYLRQRWRQGMRLFGFRLLLGALVLVGVAVLAAPVLLAASETAGVGEGIAIGAFLLLLPFVVLLGVLVGVINGFTTVFVVPVMVLEDCRVLDGWRRLWPTIRDQWKQYLAYAVAGFVLSILGGFLVVLGTGLLALLLLLPFGVLLAVAVGLFLVAEPLGFLALAVVVPLFVLAVVVAAALVQVPVQTYLRYYALLVLGDIDPDLDLVPEQRAALRESTET